MAMTDIFTPGKRPSQGHSEDYLQEKNRRIARDTLHDLREFYDSLEAEMRGMLDGVREGTPLDAPLFEKMVRVKEGYAHMMHGFEEFEYERQSHLMIIFADAVQDLLAHMHKKRRH